MLLVAKGGRIRFRMLLCEVILLSHVEVRNHLPPTERRPVSLQVADDGKLIAEDGFAALHSHDAIKRLLLLPNRGGCDVGGMGEISGAVGEIGLQEFVEDLCLPVKFPVLGGKPALVIVLVCKTQQVITDVFVVAADILLMLGRERFAGFPNLVSMMEVLHGLFQSHRYQQSNDDSCNMNDEPFSGVNRSMRWVYVEHWRCDLRGFTCPCIRGNRALRGSCVFLRHFGFSVFRHTLVAWIRADRLPHGADIG